MTDHTPHSAEEITEEIVGLALAIADGWYQGQRIDWEELLWRLEGTELADGRTLYMPNGYLDPAIVTLKRKVNQARKD